MDMKGNLFNFMDSLQEATVYTTVIRQVADSLGRIATLKTACGWANDLVH